MSKVSRSDWSASTPWVGITDKPSSFGVTDIGELTGIGYGNDTVPVYDSSSGRFRPGSRYPTPDPTPPDPAPTFIEIEFPWDVPLLYAMQCAYEDFYFPGAFPGRTIVVGAPISLTEVYVSLSASIVDLNIARITVQNLGIDDLDIAEGQWRLRIFTP